VAVAQARTGRPLDPRAPARSNAIRRLARSLDRDGVYRLITLGLAAVIWEWGAEASTSLLIPSFSDTASAFLALVSGPDLWAALAISNQSLVIGFAAAVVIGIPLGLAMGRFRRVEGFTDFYLGVLLVTPMAAIMPLIIMATGLGLTSRAILVTLSSIVVVVANTRAGVRQVDRALIDMGRSFQASELQLWRRIIIPGSMPGILSGLRLGLSQAVGAMVVIELLMVAVGIGAMMLEFRGRFMADYLYASVLVVVIEALVLVVAVDVLERVVAPWRRR
jgi:ABC-type nitrate/sulfonate/bicarbonate transport system permease component